MHGVLRNCKEIVKKIEGEGSLENISEKIFLNIQMLTKK